MSEPATVYEVGPRDRGKRLDRFLHEKIPGVSRSYIQRAIRSRITLSWGAEARSATPVRAGGRVLVGWTPVEEVLLELRIAVLARGEGWLAVDKPAGIPVHPASRVRENSLIRMLRRQEGREGLRLVHRLDRETSGVLLVAETPEAARVLSLAFERGAVRKEYLAVVRGAVREPLGVIDLPIADARGSRVYVRRETARDGQRARTRFRVERALSDRTLLRLFPETGRRHQIRVHLAAIGHPILGDILYGRADRDYLDLVRGERDARGEEGGPLRHLLHCERLEFADLAGATREIRAPVPPDFGEALADPRGEAP